MSDIEANRVNELAEILPVHVMRLGNLNTGLSLTAWNKISNDILEAATLLRALDAERARRVEVEKIVIDAAASLAAAISLLERGGERAAPSRKMFDVMITDYNKSLDRARAYFNPRAANITKEKP